MVEDRRAKKILRRCWKWSWLVTLPITAVFLLWAVNTARMYHHYKLNYVSTMELRLSDLGRFQAEQLLSKLKKVIMPRSSRSEEGLRKIQLFVRESDLRRLDSDLPYSGSEYVRGKLLYQNGEVHEVKIKYRGDFSYHWSGQKKSLRVKTKKSKLYNGVRQFNLIIPKTPSILNNYLSYLLARRLGLMAPEPELVEVFLNGEYMGVELLVEQPGEQFLRRNFKMPGDLYTGEIVGKDTYPKLPKEVFLNANFWGKDAINNHNPPDWNEALVDLASAVYGEDMDKVLDLVDLESWASLAAFMTVCQTVHIDAMHNWRLYFDPAKGKFFPLVWDPLGWDFNNYVKWVSEQTNRFDIITTIILERLHRDQRFLLAKHRAVEGFFRSGGDEYILGILEDTERLEVSLSRDFNLHFGSSYILSPGEVIDRIISFKKKVRETVAVIKEAYLEKPPVADYILNGKTGEIIVNVRGFTPLRFLLVETSVPIKGISGAYLRFLQDGRWLEKDISSYVSLAENKLMVRVPLFAGRIMTERKGTSTVLLRDAEIVPATYRFHIEGLEAEKILMVSAGYADEDEKVVRLNKVEELKVHAIEGNFHVVPLDSKPGEMVWSGEEIIEGFREVSDNLTIRPGTTVRLTPGSALIIRGRLTARGTPKRPIRFISADAGGDPWGAVVLAGRGADGSSMSDCTFTGGSGLRHDMVEYSAMLSIHNVRGVTLERCSFTDNSTWDDMVHAVYTEVTFTDCEFSGAVSDALDLDYVTGKVINSRFDNSGNDALDLMSSTVAVINSSMSRSGDKGISVGEGTEVFVWNTTFKWNTIGVQAKDNSMAVLYNVDLVDNAKTIDAYLKNWQYGDGGHVLVYKSRLVGPTPTITADKDSTIKVFDSYFPGEVGKKNKRIYLDDTVDSDLEFSDRARTEDTYRNRLGLGGFISPYLDIINPKVRGVIGDEA